ncbi:Ig-like domain-containing protein, partial [Acinetobacter sp. ULE_I010]|uniref:Ig-like domain-containing protein n=1 Tax=Acinetobacter sp. ULE_I010 TaxID=3373065 RepID=UPI003AF97BD5
MANSQDLGLNPAIGTVTGLLNTVNAIGFKPGVDVTLTFYDTITKILLKTVIVKADATGTVNYQTSEFLNGETVNLVGKNSQGLELTKTQVVKDFVAPAAPIANIDAEGTMVSGNTEPGAVIKIKNANDEVIATTTADKNGNFSVPLVPAQIASEALKVTASDGSTNHNESVPTLLVAPDKTPPAAPTNLAIVQEGSVVTGKAEPNSKIVIKDPAGNVIGTGTTDPTGSFSVSLTTPQKDNQTLSVNAIDPSNNKSLDATVKALDLTPPAAPTNLAVVQEGSVVTGKAEPNSKIVIKDPAGNVIGTGTTDPTGSFSVSLTTPQKDNQTLSVNAIDPSNNKSLDATVKALDLTPPAAPTNLAVVQEGSVVTGKAEPNSKIVIKDPAGNVIGTGTT